MASVSACLVSILSLVHIIPIVTSTTIRLSRCHTENPSPSPELPYRNLINLVSSSLARAHHLKKPPSITTTSLFSHSYGSYSISLSFGTPPQTLSFIMDTGSDLVWFPCTHHYRCKNCTSSSSTSNSTPSFFIPKQSSSSKIVGCSNPKCSWIHHQNLQCLDCNVNVNATSTTNCSQICPPYMIFYGSGLTGGVALSDTLNLPNNTMVPNFISGCSVFSSHLPAAVGIAGFGRGPASVPSQLGLNKFSFCLVSHKFDDTTRGSFLVLDSHANNDEDKTPGVNYTPLIENQETDLEYPFSIYYYVSLKEISVGGKRVKIPLKHSKPQLDGNGGTIVDSGTTLTFMVREVFDLLAAEFESEVRDYKRAREVEVLTGLRPCFNVTNNKAASLVVPELRLHFKGGADLALPVENYFAEVGDGGGAVCFMVVTDGAIAEDTMVAGGPSIILGNFLMQNFYVEYDLRNGRLGFKQQLCK